MQMSNPTSDYDHQATNPDDYSDQISFQLNQQLQLNDSDAQQLFPDSEIQDEEEDQRQIQNRDVHDDEGEEEEEEEEEDDGDFTFMYVGDDFPVSEDENGQIRPMYPLFDRKLLLDGENNVEGIDRLPMRPPVDNVFVKAPHRSPSESYGNDDDATVAPYCIWSKESAQTSPELRKKSNSTGFSKLWRLRDKVGRSNSDGRDAFVFLHSSNKTAKSSKSIETPATGDGPPVKVDAGGQRKVVKKGTKGKATASAHEVYLRSRVGQTEEDRRRSYLPYRPELMGLFTNVNGGMSRNVHPF